MWISWHLKGWIKYLLECEYGIRHRHTDVGSSQCRHAKARQTHFWGNKIHGLQVPLHRTWKMGCVRRRSTTHSPFVHVTSTDRYKNEIYLSHIEKEGAGEGGGGKAHHLAYQLLLRAVHFVSIQVTLFRSIQFAFVNLLSLVLLSYAVHRYCWAISSLKRTGCSVFFLLLVIFIK